LVAIGAGKFKVFEGGDVFFVPVDLFEDAPLRVDVIVVVGVHANLTFVVEFVQVPVHVGVLHHLRRDALNDGDEVIPEFGAGDVFHGAPAERALVVDEILFREYVGALVVRALQNLCHEFLRV
jgi:hypothetical protein